MWQFKVVFIFVLIKHPQLNIKLVIFLIFQGLFFKGVYILIFPFLKQELPPLKDCIMTKYKTLTFRTEASFNSVPGLFYYNGSTEKNERQNFSSQNRYGLQNKQDFQLNQFLLMDIAVPTC